MGARSRGGTVVVASLFIGVLIGWGTALATDWFTGFLGVSAVVIFGLGLAVVEGPTLISAIYISRRETRPWVRSAWQASGPFLGFVAYLLAYGLAQHALLGVPFLRLARLTGL